MMMKVERIAKFPFLPDIKEYSRSLNITLDDILTNPEYDSVRSLGHRRVLSALCDDKPGFDAGKEITRDLIFSYVFARILLSAISDLYLIRKFAFIEARYIREYTFDHLYDKDRINIAVDLAQSLGMKVNVNTSTTAKIHVLDYIETTHVFRDVEWLLSKKTLYNGWISISRKDLIRLLQERIRMKIEEGLPVTIDNDTISLLEEYTRDIQEELNIRAAERGDISGDLEPGAFPPCIVVMIKNLKSGVNLSHSARFTLTAFLLNINMQVDEITDLYSSHPDYNESKTRYQINQIKSIGYTPPACATIQAYGNCPGDCKSGAHPLTVYKKLAKMCPTQDPPKQSG